MLIPDSSPQLHAGVPLPCPIPEDNAQSVSSIIADAFDRLNISERARMLGRLLASVGPLGLAVIAGGAFAKYVTQLRAPEVPVSDEDAAHATPSQLSDLVRYVEQSDPQLFSGLLAMIGCDSDGRASLEHWTSFASQPN